MTLYVRNTWQLRESLKFLRIDLKSSFRLRLSDVTYESPKEWQASVFSVQLMFPQGSTPSLDEGGHRWR